MKTTEKEQAVLNTLLENKNHAPALSVDEIAASTNESMKTIKGVIGSLKKKGLAHQMDVNSTHTVTYITSKGEKLINQNK